MKLKNILKKIVPCPHCGVRSRVPIKPGKCIKITCPSCKHHFEIMFQSPLEKLKFNPFKNKSHHNWMPLAIGLVLVLLLKTCFLSPPDSKKFINKTQPLQQPYQESSPILNI